MQRSALLIFALLATAGLPGCQAIRTARAEREMREFWGDGYDKAKAEMDGATYAAWVLSWEDGPPVTFREAAAQQALPSPR
jgi:hypothetical protein